MTDGKGSSRPTRSLVEAATPRDGLPRRETDSAEETRKLVHELRSHQLELEMQNEELRRTHAELEAARSRFFDLYEVAPVGYCTLGERGVVRSANLTAALMFDVTRREILDQPFNRFIAEADQDVFYLHCKQVLDSGARRSCEVRMKRGGGLQFWARLETIAVREEDGEVVIRVAVSDFTEQKFLVIQSEMEREFLEFLSTSRPLAETLNRLLLGYEALLPGLRGSVLLLDAAGKHLHHVAAPNLPPDFRRALDGIEIGPNVGSCGTAAYTGKSVMVADVAADSRWRNFRDLARAHGLRACWSVPIFGTSGRVLGTFAFYSDVPRTPRPAEQATIERGSHLARLAIERHMAESALEQSEAFSLAILDSVTAEIVVLDRGGVIVTFNQPWRRFAAENVGDSTRPEEGTGVGANYLAVCDEATGAESEYGSRAAAGIRSILDESSASFRMEYPCHSPQRQRWFTMRATPLGSDCRGVVIAHTDISERRKAETDRASLEVQLRESQKMEAVGTLAGGIAHDFNNILAVILGNAELAHEEMTGHVAALESLEEIRKAGQRARNLVQQILSFSRRQPTERKRVEVAAIVAETVRLLRATFPARVSLGCDCAQDVPDLMADATQIEQVLINLATNSMHAMHGSPGHIRFALDSAVLDAALAGSHPELRAMHAERPGLVVRLVVSDDGAGMDAATLGRIFDPFFTTKPVDGGTGLGLSVVHGIVQAHEGAIVVDSRPGEGSTFTVYLPAAEALLVAPGHTPAEVAVTRPSTAGQSRRILFLDDDRSLVLLVERMLERRGVVVDGFSTAAEALAALRVDSTRFDVVVTDYNMPGMSGLDVAREVRAIRDDLPVVIASGFVDETLRAQAGAAGVKELIFKADTAEGLCDALERLASTAREASGPS